MRPHIIALAILAVATPTLAEITGVFSTVFLTSDASIEIAGVIDDPEILLEPIILDQLGELETTNRSVAASIPEGSARSDISAAAAIDINADRLELDYSATATGVIATTAPDGFGFVKSRVASTTRFATDRPVELTLSGDASRMFSLFGETTPLISQLRIAVINEFDDTLVPLFLDDPQGAIDETVSIAAGAWQLQIATDTTFRTFGFPEGEWTAESTLDLSASIVTVPAPSAAALLAAFGLLRRRLR
jgi:hypothetical protein